MVPELGSEGAYLYDLMNKKLIEHQNYIKDVGVDMDEIKDWKWD